MKLLQRYSRASSAAASFPLKTIFTVFSAGASDFFAAPTDSYRGLSAGT
ncbi:MAG: hypothetical protein BWY00_01774 [Firmicutes bacterium ADurb.Bin153]|nr:MAG: hypothetical protein BWY00_01774 [Firmicutes bacterium ADurb.Bin153]